MVKILEATYIDGNLVLSDKLNPELEGKTFKIMILETEEMPAIEESDEKAIAA